jgi:membrane-associated protein
LDARPAAARRRTTRALGHQYGPIVYGILFAIIFAETGLVVTPFLPGDSLLFAAGALAATSALQIEVMVPVLIVAAVLGDAVNYSIGRRLAHRFLEDQGDSPPGLHRWVKREHVLRAHEFFVKHGGKAVVLARFVPIVRTFVPFVAGGAAMPYRTFAFYNVVGAILWVGICAGAGYLFGNIPVVKDNFELVVLGIIGVSVLPLVYRSRPVLQESRGLRMSESIGSNGPGMKLHTKILLGLAAGALAGVITNLTVGAAHPGGHRSTTTSPTRWARSSCACCSWWSCRWYSRPSRWAWRPGRHPQGGPRRRQGGRLLLR